MAGIPWGCAEAEPLMRRMVGIFLRFTAGTGHRHPHLLAAMRNYEDLCLEMEVPGEEFFRRLREMGAEAGLGEAMGVAMGRRVFFLWVQRLGFWL